MAIKCGINNNKTNVVANMINGMFLKAKAEEPSSGETPVTPPVPTETVIKPPVVNYEDLIAKARKEEKDKLYAQLQAKDNKIAELTEKNNGLLLDVTSKDEEIKTLKNEVKSVKSNSTKSDNEKIKGLEEENSNLLTTIDQLKATQTNVDTLETQIKNEYEVKLYRLEKLHTVGEDIISELVTGTTKEEIDSSFEVAKAKYDSIKSKYISKSTQGIPMANVDTSAMNNKSINAGDISKMSPTEWSEYRGKLGLK